MSSLIVVEKWIGLGGVQTFTRNLRSILVRNGQAVDLIVYGCSSRVEAEQNDFRYFPGLWGLWDIFVCARGGRYREIFINQPKSLFVALFTPSASKFYYVVHIDADHFLFSFLRRVYFIGIVNWLGVTVLVMSHENIEKLRILGIKRELLIYIKPPLFEKLSVNLPSSSERKYDLIFFGRFAPQKDPVKFIEICKELRERGVTFSALMVGAGELDNEVNRLLLENDLSNIKNVGEVSRDVAFKLLEQSKFYVMTSTHEGLGFTLIEASMCGAIPVSGPIEVGPREMIADCGVPVEDMSRASYVDKVELILNMPRAQLLELQQRAITFASGYSYEAVEDQIKSIISDS